MPRISTYQSNPVLPQPVATPESKGAGVGRAMQGLGNTISQAGALVEARQTQRETTQIAAESAKAQADLANQWQETLRTADPNDPDIAKNFQEQVVQPRLEGITGLAKTRDSQAYAIRSSAEMAAHFSQTTVADQAHLSSAADVVNLDQSANALSAAAATNPNSLDFVIGQFGTMSENLMRTHGLSREQKLAMDNKFQSQAALAAAKGTAEINPEGLQQELADGKYDKYLDGAAQQELNSYAISLSNSRAAAAKRQAEAVADGATSEYLEGMINQDTGQIQVTPDMFKKLASDPRFQTPEGASQGRVIFDMMNAELNREKAGSTRKSDPATYANYRSRLFLGADDPNKLTMADIQGGFAAGNLDAPDMDWFREQLAGNDPVKKKENKQLDDMLAGYKSSIGASSLMVSKPLGDQRFLAFSQDMQTIFDHQRAAGKSADALLDPRSKDFIGKDWQKYAVSDADAMNQMLKKPISALPPTPYGVTQSIGQQAAAPVSNQSALATLNAPVLTTTSTPAEVKQVVPIVADKYGVPKHIAMALVEQESRFKPTAGSPTGATGLTQLTQPIELKYGLQNNDPDPNKNLDAGLHYLADLKKQWGTWELALKHYGDANQTGYSSEVLARSVKYQTGDVMNIETNAEYAALPSGAKFVGPDGKQRKKP